MKSYAYRHGVVSYLDSPLDLYSQTCYMYMTLYNYSARKSLTPSLPIMPV